MDAQLQDFYARVARVEAAHARGYGFEAQGLLGRSHYIQKPRRRRSMLKPLIVTFLCVTALKATIYREIGAETYLNRVTELTAGTGVDRFGGYIMTADPATVWLSAQMDTYLPSL